MHISHIFFSSQFKIILQIVKQLLGNTVQFSKTSCSYEYEYDDFEKENLSCGRKCCNFQAYLKSSPTKKTQQKWPEQLDVECPLSSELHLFNTRLLVPKVLQIYSNKKTMFFSWFF